MKLSTIIFIAIILTVLFGTIPLTVLGTVLKAIADVILAIARALDLFGWSGVGAFMSNIGGDILHLTGGLYGR